MFQRELVGPISSSVDYVCRQYYLHPNSLWPVINSFGDKSYAAVVSCKHFQSYPWIAHSCIVLSGFLQTMTSPDFNAPLTSLLWHTATYQGLSKVVFSSPANQRSATPTTDQSEAPGSIWIVTVITMLFGHWTYQFSSLSDHNNKLWIIPQHKVIYLPALSRKYDRA